MAKDIPAIDNRGAAAAPAIDNRGAAAAPAITALQQIKQQPYGARFYKADLHFHTPASEDARGKNRYNFNPYRTVKYPDNDHSFEYHQKVRAVQEQVLREARGIAEKIVDRFIAEQIGLVAITDHNGIGTIWPDPEDPAGRSMDLAAPTWYELIGDEAERRNHQAGRRVLTILPGTEISTNGVHILAVLPPMTPRRQAHFIISALLTEIGFTVADFGKNPKVGSASVVDTLRLIAAKGGLPIIAHIDGSDQALLKLFELGGGAMRGVLTNPNLGAVEVVDPARLSQPDKKLEEPVSTWIDRARDEEGLDAIAYFQGSDSHELERIGERFTYVKMTEPSFEGLGAAIQVPASRLRLGGLYAPPEDGLYLYGAEVCSAALPQRVLRFNRHMNCIVGRKECGKSHLFRLLESAANPSLPAEGDVRLFVDRREAGKSNLFCFSRWRGKHELHRLVEADGAYRVEAMDPASAEAQALRPRFFHEDRVNALIGEEGALQEFLARHFGAPTAESALAFNQTFSLPVFLKATPSPLLVVQARAGRYELSLNVAWRAAEARLVPFASLSRSQRRLVLISIILVTGNNGPLLIDEPGDHFDNEDIAQLLVPLVKQLKDARQIIFATTNSNLAINSDPDNYVVLESEGGKLKELHAGFAIDNQEQRDRLTKILEGGLKSFRQRDRRYKVQVTG